MSTPALLAPARSVPLLARAAAYIELTKPKIALMVLVAVAASACVASWRQPTWAVAHALFGTLLVAASSCAANQWLERYRDGLMKRTADRPLPAGRLDPRLAFAFAMALGLLSIPLLALCANPLTGLLGATALVMYAAIYTPMKQHSPMALQIGAIPGALPPLMGWAAATGRIDAPGVVLFGILFLWQITHFLAIALFRKDEYSGAGFKVLPAVRGIRVAKIHALIAATILLPVSLLLVPLRVVGPVYLAAALTLGIGFWAVSLWGLRKSAGPAWARVLFFTSLVYLTLLFAVLMLDRGA